MNLSFIPNLITLARVIILAPLTVLLLREDYYSAMILFIIAGFSDALDGFLAKQFSWVSRFGAILDPLADKALLVITMTILAYNQKISWLLLAVVIVRDVYIVAGAYYFHYRLGPYEMSPSKLSKLNTFVQLLLVTCLLFSLGLEYSLPLVFLQTLVILTYLTTISSGVHYGWVWGARFKQEVLAQRMAAKQKKKQADANDQPPSV